MVSLLFGKRYPRTKISHIELDATISENHDYSSIVTQFPVENGSTISDHIFLQPAKLSIEGLISDSPLSNSGNPIVTVATTLNQFFSLNSGPTRSNAIFDELMQLYEKRQVITVVTGLKIYKDMAIVSLNIPRSAATGQALNFRMELIQLKFATTLSVDYQYIKYTNSTGDITTREQIGSNTNFPKFSNDPPDSFKDQGQNFVDVGTQTLQQLKPAAADIVLTTYNSLKVAGVT